MRRGRRGDFLRRGRRSHIGGFSAKQRTNFLYTLETSRAELEKILTIFTDCAVDFCGSVRPGDRVTTTGRVKFFRRKKLRASFEMKLDDGTLVCSGELSGMGVPR